MSSILGAHNVCNTLFGSCTTTAYGGSFQGDPTYGALWTWANTYQYQAQLGTHVDQMLNLYEQGTNFSNTWSSGQAETYGVSNFARSVYGAAPNGNISGGSGFPFLPSHASGANIYDSVSQVPGGTVITTTSRCVASYGTISAATNSGGNWQVTVPSGVSTCLAVGDLAEIRCDGSAFKGAPCQWSGLGRVSITAISGQSITISTTHGGDSYTANSALFIPMSIGVTSCAALTGSSGGNVPKEIFIENGSNRELWYVDSCTGNVASAWGGNAVYSSLLFGNAYVVFALGRAYEMDFTKALPMRWVSTYYANGLTNPGMNPYLFKMGYHPTVKASDGRTGISSWADVKAAAYPSMRNDTTAQVGAGYRYMEFSFGATSFCPASWTNCAAAQSWMATNLQPSMTPAGGVNIMKWDFLPRSCTAPSITSTNLPVGTSGLNYSYTFTATGDPTITWSATGLPGWASLNASTGVLSGTASAGTSTINVTAANACGSAGPTGFTLQVNASLGASVKASALTAGQVQ